MNIIGDKIKKIFGKKQHFAEYLEIDPKDFSKKLKTVQSKINWLNDFLKPLNLKIIVVEIETNGSET
ncbi:MAG: hypothetical protein GY849_02690 [Deltaproteobacteria bacterium]|nr:hypothetical protein [Deltaproteobacteria bacterium]